MPPWARRVDLGEPALRRRGGGGARDAVISPGRPGQPALGRFAMPLPPCPPPLQDETAGGSARYTGVKRGLQVGSRVG